MKKVLILFAVMMFVGFSAFSQVEKGKFLLGGTTAFSYSSVTVTPEYDGEEATDFEVKTSEITFAPKFGYFVMDNLAVGLDLSYSTAKGKVGDGDWSDPTTELGASLFGRYYFGASSFKPFGQVQFGYMSMSESDEDVDKFAGLMYGLTLGGDYFLNDNVALELGVSYDMGKLKNKDDDKLAMKPGALSFGLGVVVTF